MIGLDLFKQILQENGGRLPLLTLEEFFSGNSEEDSIAPNRWGYGRPSLAEMWGMLRGVELRENVAWVRVSLHDDTEMADAGGEAVLRLVGESIVICTDLDADALEEIVDCEWLCSDGVVASDPARWFSCVPPIPRGFACREIVWD